MLRVLNVEEIDWQHVPMDLGCCFCRDNISTCFMTIQHFESIIKLPACEECKCLSEDTLGQLLGIPR